MVPAYFLSMCFYLDAISDDFEGVFQDLHKSINTGFTEMVANLTIAINLHTSMATYGMIIFFQLKFTLYKLIFHFSLFKQMVQVTSGTIFIQVIGDTIFTSSSFFQMEAVSINK